jgi:hypothetical protein
LIEISCLNEKFNGGSNLKRITHIGLSILLIGLVTVNCKKSSDESKSETKKSAKLDDSTFVEIAAEQNLLIQRYQIKGQQLKSDSEKAVIADEFKKETEEILSEHGISRAQIDSYIEVIQNDTQKTKELQEKIVKRIKEKITEEGEPGS